LDMKASSGDVARHPSPACLTGYVLDLLVAAAPLESDVAGSAAFSPLVLSQRRVSRHGDLRGSTRHDRRGGGEAGEAGSHHGDAGASGTEGVGRGVDEELRFQGQDADGGPIA
jgi:hypothetical protein